MLEGQSEAYKIGCMILIVFVVIVLLHGIRRGHVWDQNNETRTELKSQITALTEALEKHDEVLKELSERKEWWKREE